MFIEKENRESPLQEGWKLLISVKNGTGYFLTEKGHRTRLSNGDNKFFTHLLTEKEKAFSIARIIAMTHGLDLCIERQDEDLLVYVLVQPV
ncbi:MAG TPA: hypothetical protein VKO42_03620 [Patescibacteria group bacterium]|nr:hypothetical protein [Patescibacteria group bacterium]